MVNPSPRTRRCCRQNAFVLAQALESRTLFSASPGVTATPLAATGSEADAPVILTHVTLTGPTTPTRPGALVSMVASVSADNGATLDGFTVVLYANGVPYATRTISENQAAFTVTVTAGDTAFTARLMTETGLGNGMSYSAATGSYYLAVPASMNWLQAYDAAAARTFRGVQGRLVTITSAEENEAAAAATRTAGGGDSYWTGGYQLRGATEPGGGWVWFNGEPFTYFNWNSGEPNDIGGENHLEFYSGHGHWNDLNGNSSALSDGYLVEFAGVGTYVDGVSNTLTLQAVSYHHEIAAVLEGPASAAVGETVVLRLAIDSSHAYGFQGVFAKLYDHGQEVTKTVLYNGTATFAFVPAEGMHQYTVRTGTITLPYSYGDTGHVQSNVLAVRVTRPANPVPTPPTVYARLSGPAVVDSGTAFQLTYTIDVPANATFENRIAALEMDGRVVAEAVVMNGAATFKVEGAPGDHAFSARLLPALATTFPAYLSAADSYYTMVPGTYTWEAARDYAAAASYRGIRGHLAVITSAVENEFLVQRVLQVTRGYGSSYWLGGYQPVDAVEPSGGWRWITGEPFIFAPWSDGEPNDYLDGEDYLELGVDAGRWNDLSNGLRYLSEGFVIEFQGPAYDAVRAGSNTLLVHVGDAAGEPPGEPLPPETPRLPGAFISTTVSGDDGFEPVTTSFNGVEGSFLTTVDVAATGAGAVAAPVHFFSTDTGMSGAVKKADGVRRRGVVEEEDPVTKPQQTLAGEVTSPVPATRPAEAPAPQAIAEKPAPAAPAGAAPGAPAVANRPPAPPAPVRPPLPEDRPINTLNSGRERGR